MSRKLIVPKLAVLHALTPEQLEILADAGETAAECPAVMLGKDVAESVAALAAIKSGALEPVGRDPRRVSPVAPKSAPVYIRRADGNVQKFALSIGLAATLSDGGAEPEVL